MPNSREFRVAVVGIPLREGAFGVEMFDPGTTNKIRDRVVAHLKTLTKALEERGISLTVSDCGEITHDAIRSSWYSAGEKTPVIKEHIPKMVRELKDAHDLVLIIGGRHSVAYSMYQFPGKVARVDYHADTGNEREEKLYNGRYIHWGNYMRHVIAIDKLKKTGDIENYGMQKKGAAIIKDYGREKEEEVSLRVPTFRLGLTDIQNTTARYFDIDSDGLHKMYEASPERFPLNPKGVAASALGKAFLKNGPEIVGFFEYHEQEKYEKESKRIPRLERLITALSAAAVRGAAAHKFNLEVPMPKRSETRPWPKKPERQSRK